MCGLSFFNYFISLSWYTMRINVEENVAENDFPNDNDSHHSGRTNEPY